MFPGYCSAMGLAGWLVTLLVWAALVSLAVWGIARLFPGSIPTDSVPADAVPAKSVPAKSVPADAVPAESVPAESVPAKSVPAKSVPAKSVPAATRRLPEAGPAGRRAGSA